MKKMGTTRYTYNSPTKSSFKFILIFTIFILLIALFFTSFYTISAGERGVLLTFGKPSMDAVGEGLHFKVPFIQQVKVLEVRTRKIEAGSDSASKDLQDVQTTIALNYHLMPASTPLLYQEVGLAYAERIIDPTIQESVKSISARFTAEELITKRSEVRLQMQESISEKLAVYHIKVDGLNIVNFQFSASFDDAIEQKVTAEQLKLKAERDLERIMIEAQQTIESAKAEAESLRLQKMEITPDLVRLREIEAQIKAIEKWNGIMPQVTGGAMPFIDLRQTPPSTQTQ